MPLLPIPQSCSSFLWRLGVPHTPVRACTSLGDSQTVVVVGVSDSSWNVLGLEGGAGCGKLCVTLLETLGAQQRSQPLCVLKPLVQNISWRQSLEVDSDEETTQRRDPRLPARGVGLGTLRGSS